MSERPDVQDRLADAPGMVDASRDRLRTLAEQQAALRRVATLVASGVEPSEVFGAVADEMRGCLNAMTAGLWRFETSGEITLLAAAADSALLPKVPPVGTRSPSEGDNLASVVLRTGGSARIDDYATATGPTAAELYRIGIRAAVGVPVIVDGRLWGMAAVASFRPGAMPPDTEARIGDFADLVGTAIANAATRDELAVLAEQQAALRRVATLVARGVNPSEVFSAVADEMVRCVNANAAVHRLEGDTLIIVALAGFDPGAPSTPVVGESFPVFGSDDDNVAAVVIRTARAARVDSHENAAGPLAARLRELGLDSVVAAPIIVDGSTWGLASVGAPKRLPPNTEERLCDFADLVATALANAATRDELIASRARIVTAADDARRRLERDLHDGAQQRLVSLGLQLRLAEHSVPTELRSLKEQLSGIVSGLTAVTADLQEISRGIHPAILSEGGLAPALRTLARRCPVPANVDVLIEGRLPESVEVAAYYVVAEALTNAAKYAQASKVNVCAEVKEDNLCLSIQDDGVGGADSRKGSGLIGLQDRVEVLGGYMKVISPPGSGTSLRVTIPLTG
jgi:signal transduction histidine kinase